MTRMFLLLAAVALCVGCKVTAGVYVERDWQTGTGLKNPDLRTKVKLEATRQFESWPHLVFEE